MTMVPAWCQEMRCSPKTIEKELVKAIVLARRIDAHVKCDVMQLVVSY